MEIPPQGLAQIQNRHRISAMKGSFSRTLYRGTESVSESFMYMRVSGSRVKWMEMVEAPGMTLPSKLLPCILDSTKRGLNMAMVSIVGVRSMYIREIGSKVKWSTRV
jgi:hypothetical protein